MKVARSAAVAGCGGTSNVAAAMRYGLRPVGTMAHSYVLSFDSEEEAFRAFMEDFPETAVMLVDTYDTLEGVRHAIAASRETGMRLAGVRLDSGDLLELSRAARRLLDEAGMSETRIVASGDLEEGRIAELVAAGAPIDLWGVGTDLGTSRDSPVVNGVYKLVADRRGDGWRGVWKRSPDKADGARPEAGVPPLRRRGHERRRDRRGGRGARGRAAAGAGDARRRAWCGASRSSRSASAPPPSSRPCPRGCGGPATREAVEPYPVSYSERLRAAIEHGLAARGEEGLQERGRLAGQQAAVDLGAVVEAGLAEDVEHAARGARLRIGRPVDDARHASEHDRARAHRARLQGHVEDRVGDAPAAEPLRGLAHRQHLGMGGGIGAQLALVARRGEHLALAHDRPPRSARRRGRRLAPPREAPGA